MKQVLYVLWRTPRDVLPDNIQILSFLSPAEEELIAANAGVNVIHGRSKVVEVKADALDIYRQLVVRIGHTKNAKGFTLRQELARPGCASRWWYHRLAVRDSESQPLFGWIIQTLVVQNVAAREASSELVLVGAPPGLADILRGIHPVISLNPDPSILCWKSIVFGLGSRMRFLFSQLRYRWAIGQRLPPNNRQFDLIFSSFWDWGVIRDKGSGALTDRYFKELPKLLASDARITSGYFAWLDPYYETGQLGRPLAQILKPLIGHTDVILLQGQLTFWEIVKVVLDFTPWFKSLAAWRIIAEQKLLCNRGLDWMPLFGPALLHSCVGAQIPYYELVGIATEKAARRHRPRISLTFLDHFPYARAHYDGVRRAGINAVNWAMQHAGYCHEKTFFYIHPRFEYAGEPDGCRVPVPDRVFAMGRLSYNIFRECGYREDQVIMTGSARYDHIRFVPDNIVTPPVKYAKINILLACTLELESEISLVEATSLAAQGLPGLSLRLRNHPSNRVDAHSGFAPYRETMDVSSNSLEADLAWAHVVLFTYSTVADEAYLLGKCVWQWMPLRFNGSALAEAMSIPTFTSVAQLRAALQSTLATGGPPVVNASDRSIAAEKLFAPADGGAARRIAKQVIDWLDHGDAAP